MVWCHTFLGNLGTDTCAKWVLVSRFPRMIYITNKTTVKPEEFNKLVCVWGHNLPKHYFPKSGLNWIDWCWLLYYNASCWFLQSSPFTFENNKVWIKTKSVLSRKMIICAIIIYKIQKKKELILHCAPDRTTHIFIIIIQRTNQLWTQWRKDLT